MITREINIKWTVEDVDAVIRDRELVFEPELTDVEKGDVLENVLNHHDANEGITWNTIAFWIEELYGGRHKEKRNILCS